MKDCEERAEDSSVCAVPGWLPEALWLLALTLGVDLPLIKL